MNTINLSGDYIYWPLAGSNLDLNVSKSIFSSFQNIIVPISELSIPSDISDIKYVLYNERFYFLIKNRKNTIFSQYFPNASKNKARQIKGKIDFARHKFSSNDLEEFPVDDYSVIKLISTKKHLFALALHDEKKKYYILRITLSEEGFEGSFYINELSINADMNLHYSEIEATDIDDYKTKLYFHLKNENCVFFSEFHAIKKKRIAQLQNLEILTTTNYSVKAFCKINIGKGVESMAIFDEPSKSLILLDFNEKNKKFIVNYKQTVDKEITGISYFHIDSHHIDPKLEAFGIDMMLLYNKNKLWTFNIATKQLLPLIGNGPTNICLPARNDNLNNYIFHNLIALYPVDNCCLIFNDTQNKDLFVLLSAKLRNLLFLKSEPQRYSQEVKEKDRS